MSNLYSALPPLFRPREGAQPGEDVPLPYTSEKVPHPGPTPVPTQPSSRPAVVADYREALLAFWQANASDTEITPKVASAIYNDVVKAIDEVGEPLATTLRHRWEAEWHAERGVCPRCGEPGERHE